MWFQKEKAIIDEQKIEDLLSRGVFESIPEQEIKDKLYSGRVLRVKMGIDPTSPNIHLGRAVAIHKLRVFQELGHKIVFLIGDFTGVIGDTSDKESERPMLTQDIVSTNMASYFDQVGKILDMSKVEKHYNSEWLSKLAYKDISLQADAFSVADFIARENIKKRLDAGTRVSLREVLYPLMQGYDSVAIKADIEIGGSDQKFNLLAGRKLQEKYKQSPQSVMMVKLLAGLDGRKMSSSWGNTINLTDSAKDMFGKVMSLSDSLIMDYADLAAYMNKDEAEAMSLEINKGGNPKDQKILLAKKIVGLYHSNEQAEKEALNFEKTFSNKEIPDDVLVVSGNSGDSLSALFIDSGVIASMSEFRRLVQSGAIETENGEKISDVKCVAKSGKYRIGKKRFISLNIK
jgi:tyrosyl-tRNA synthetase